MVLAAPHSQLLPIGQLKAGISTPTTLASTATLSLASKLPRQGHGSQTADNNFVICSAGAADRKEPGEPLVREPTVMILKWVQGIMSSVTL